MERSPTAVRSWSAVETTAVDLFTGVTKERRKTRHRSPWKVDEEFSHPQVDRTKLGKGTPSDLRAKTLPPGLVCFLFPTLATLFESSFVPLVNLLKLCFE